LVKWDEEAKMKTESFDCEKKKKKKKEQKEFIHSF